MNKVRRQEIQRIIKNTLATNEVMEADTVKERAFTLKLSDKDAEAIFLKASEVGLTVSELLENFIADLTDGIYSNGSDEYYQANEWFERCGFSVFAEKTFLHYLLEQGQIEDFLNEYDNMQSAKDDISYSLVQIASGAEEIYDELEEAQEEFCRRECALQTYYGEYTESTHKAQKTPQSYQEGLAAILAWREEYNKVRGLDLNQPQK